MALRRDVRLGERWFLRDGASVMSDMSRLLLASSWSSSVFTPCSRNARNQINVRLQMQAMIW